MTLPSLQEGARLLGGEVQGGQIVCPGPGHSPTDRSLTVRHDPQAPEGFLTFSHAENTPQECRDHVRDRYDLEPWKPNGKRHANGNGHAQTGAPPTIAATYPYQDEEGEVLLEVVRYAPKQFRQRRRVKDQWVWSVKGVRVVPYRLPELMEAIAAERTVLVVEGEKDVHSLARIGVTATCNAMGAGKWTAEHAAFLTGADVVVVPDSDASGRKHAHQVGASLQGVAARVRMLELPGLAEHGDASDWLAAGRTADELWRLIEAAPEWNEGGEAAHDWRKLTITAAALQHKVFPPVFWIVPTLIPEGLTLIAGKPKIGKSFLGLDLCLGVAGGGFCLGGIKTETGDVLYLALEDTERRLQQRIDKLSSPLSTAWSERLTVAWSWRRLNEGGLDDIAQWAQSVPNPRLVMIDTLAAARPIGIKDGFAQDYETLAPLQRFVGERRLAGVVLHHARKLDAEDPIDMISGTLGLAGSADTVMVLKRTPAGTILYGRGRDVEEMEKAVEFHRESCRWRLLGDAEEVRRSDTRKAILAALVEFDEPMTPKQIAGHCKITEELAWQTLSRMVKAGECLRLKRGSYGLRRPEEESSH